MSRAKNQHWAPYFYLRYFATPETRRAKEAKAWIFSKREGDGNETLANVRKICTKRYLYSPVNESGNREWDLEEKLADLECGVSEMWPELAEGFVDLQDRAIRNVLSLFLGTLHLRHPDMLAMQERVHGALTQLLDARPKEVDGSPGAQPIDVGGDGLLPNPGEWSAYRAAGKDAHHRAFAQFMRSEAIRTAELLMAKRWSIAVAEKDTFITSDKPVSVGHASKSAFGLRTPGVLVTVPISPTRVLVMDDQHSEPANQYYSVGHGAAVSCNCKTWSSCSRFMITGRPVADVLEEVTTWGDGRAATER